MAAILKPIIQPDGNSADIRSSDGLGFVSVAKARETLCLVAQLKILG